MADERKIQEKLKLMNHYDADIQFMAAADLITIIDKDHAKIPEPIIVKIIDALLEHLKSESADVHGNAIKCLSQIIPKIPIAQSKRISQSMIYNIKDPLTNPDFRDIYGTCIKTIINDVPVGSGDQIKDLLKIAIDATLEFAQAKANIKIEQELIDISGSFIKKWPKLVRKIAFDMNALLQYLLKNIIIRNEAVLQKRSYVFLGILSAILNQVQLQKLLFDQGLLTYLINQKALNNLNIERRKYVLQGLASVLKNTHNRDINVNKIFTSVLDEIHFLISSQVIGKQDVIGEMLESSISALTSLTKHFPVLTQSFNQQIIQFIGCLTEYSPHNDIEYLNKEAMQAEPEEDEYEIQDQSPDDSWRVRKAALNLVAEIGKHNRQIAHYFITRESIYVRLAEKQSNVIVTALTTLQNLLSQCDNQDVDSIIKGVYAKIKDLFEQKSVEDGIKVQISAFLMHLSKSHIPQSQTIQHYIDMVMSVLKYTKQQEVKINLLTFLENILKCQAASQRQQILQLLLEFANSAIYKISGAAFRAISSYLSAFTFQNNQPVFIALVERLVVKFRQSDIDQEIKVLVAKTVSDLLKYHSNTLNQLDYETLVNTLDNKLNLQVQKRYILTVLASMNGPATFNKSTATRLNKIVKSIATSFLNHFDTSIKSKAVEAIDNLVRILPSIQPQTAATLLQKSKPVIAQETIPEYFSRLVELNVANVKQFLSVILKAKNISEDVVLKFIKFGSATPDEIMLIIKANMNNDNVDNYVRLLTKMNVDVSTFEKSLNDSVEGRLAIGLLGHSRLKQYFKPILSFINNKSSQETKNAASAAVGIIVAHNLDLLPVLLSRLQAKQQTYSILSAIRSTISNSKNITPELIQLQRWLFSHAQQENQSQLNLSAECIGLIAGLHPASSKPIFEIHLKEHQTKSSLMIATSFRYFLGSCHPKEDVGWYLPILLFLTNHDLLDIKIAAIKSLNSIAFHNPAIVVDSINYQFFKTFRKNLNFDEKLVESVDYGVSKQKVDRGRPLRLNAFSFIETAIDKTLTQSNKYLESEFLSSALETLQTDTSNDVLIRRLNVIEKLFDTNQRIFDEVQDLMVAKLNKGKLSQFVDKKNNEDQNVEKIITQILRIISKLYNTSTKLTAEFKHMYDTLKGIERYGSILRDLQKQDY